MLFRSDVAAGSLLITEAGGLIGNFTGEADYLYQREVVAGNPKVYAQLVQMLAPYTRVIKEDEHAPAARPSEATPDATAAFVSSAATPAPAAAAPAIKRAPVRIRRGEAEGKAPAGDRPAAKDDDAPF